MLEDITTDILCSCVLDCNTGGVESRNVEGQRGGGTEVSLTRKCLINLR